MDKKETACISLKTLYETGYRNLKFDRSIRHTTEDNQDYFNIVSQEGITILCDGEEVEILNKDNDSVLVKNQESGCIIRFSLEEFGIATFRPLCNQ